MKIKFTEDYDFLQFRFGNLYEYRSAFFSDVMYSNNVPGREGKTQTYDSEFLIVLCYFIATSIFIRKK